MVKNQKKLEKLASIIFNTKRLIFHQSEHGKDFNVYTALSLEVLRFISENGGVVMKDVAKYLRIKPASATSLVNGLVNKGFLIRVKNEKDRRLVQLQITLTGKKFIKAGFEKIVNEMAEIMSVLSDKEISLLIEIHKKLNNEINKNK